ncbi:MAG TPA: hypothetical protein VK131_08415, partial [Candidatus Acidoferrales bacterium]|nr:hypothetical protein [Candidatus Acidoferrales bacterium]
GRPLTPAADVYSLAATAYVLLTGRPPFTGESPLAVVLAHVRQRVTPPRQLNPELTPTAEAALLRGLAKAPEARFASASGLVLALQARPPVATTGRRLRAAARVLGSAAAAAAALALVSLPAGPAQSAGQAGRSAVLSLLERDFRDLPASLQPVAELPPVADAVAGGLGVTQVVLPAFQPALQQPAAQAAPQLAARVSPAMSRASPPAEPEREVQERDDRHQRVD